MDFLDLDTSLKITRQNIILYSAWLLNNEFQLNKSLNRSGFIKDNIGFVDSNPGAVISYLKKSGLVDSQLRTSNISKCVANRVINYNEYCLIHLSKESLFLNNTPKVNVLALICRYIVEKKSTQIDLNEIRELNIDLGLQIGNNNSNKRTDYLSAVLEGTDLFDFVGKKEEGIMQLKDDTYEIIKFLDDCAFENCNENLNDDKRFDYFSSTERGILDCLNKILPSNWEKYFPNLNSSLNSKIAAIVEKHKPISSTNAPLQQIFYGAPGTGKSFTIDDISKSFVHYRTTFHPDSDYSTFVGCYKPQNVSGERIYDKMELKNKLNIIKNSGVSYPCQKFATKYWQSLKLLLPGDIKEILTECEFTDSMSSEILKGIGIGEELMPDQYNSRIVYQFCPQVFTRAYVEAWKQQEKGEKVYLVIEEINRGNCAQIFGDLFQLLDRDENGFSKYEIVPDTDLMQYLKSQSLNAKDVLDSDGNDISLAINSGELMKLPNNLYLRATMNTSDQSLFPIDSAFKRRWEWEYMPIKRAVKAPEKNWIIKVTHDDKTYWCYWWEFLEAINHRIENATHSEDKQLGYFFAKPMSGDNFISTDTFVNKVIFYLWNDVFKDEDDLIFKYGNSIEDVQVLHSGNMYFRHFIEDKDKMIHYFINQLFSMGVSDNPVVPIDYLKNDKDDKVVEHLSKMRLACDDTPMPVK